MNGKVNKMKHFIPRVASLERWLPRMQKLQSRSQLWLRLHRFILCTGARGVLPMRVGGTTSQLDLLSLRPLSVAGCGLLRLEVPHWLLH